MLKSKKVLLGSLMASGLILGACANDSDGGGDSSEVVTLELFSNKAENVETYERLIEQFEEQHENIKIQLESPPEAETVLRTRLTRNDMPDIMSIGGNATYGELGKEGVLYDFTDEESMSNIQPAYKDMLSRLVGSEIEEDYGVPYATNANGVIYNQELFDEYGMEVPQTWDELISLLDQAQEEGIAPIQFTLQEAWTALPTWNSLGGVLAPENFGEMKTNGEASFQENYDEVADKYLELLAYGEGDIFGVGYDDGNANFANGEALFYMQGNWAIPEIERNNEDIELGFFAFPASNDEAENDLVSGVDVLLTVSESTDHPEEALAFVEFMLQDEVAAQYIEEQAAFSSIEGVMQENPVFEDIQGKFETGSLTSFPDHFYPAGLGAENLIQEFLIEQNKEQFLQTMDSEWDAVINR
ncbi:ABC transporter substrate-binding protein [Alkalibacterium sp. f15]|uniref:ABC transporter substrate-binding protein n=1 Tax=Alkalibacterium sp. f15 TaxID=3414029 RepID=UPI003BF81B16